MNENINRPYSKWSTRIDKIKLEQKEYRQCCLGLKRSVITIALSLVSTPTFIAFVVVSMHEKLYDKYLCLMASNKQQIYWEEVKESTGKLGYLQCLSGYGFMQNISSQSHFVPGG